MSFLLLGIAIGTIGTEAGLAQTVVQKIEVALDATKLMVNGQPVAFDKSSDLPLTINYRGTTYAPIRLIGETLHQKVNYDSGSNTVNIAGTDEQISHAIKAQLKQNDLLSFSFTLKNESDKNQQLTFNSGQRYGYKITDDKGNQIKLWPMGIMFTQVVSEVQLKPGEEISYPIKIDSLPNGVYTLNVWSVADEGLGANTTFEIK